MWIIYWYYKQQEEFTKWDVISQNGPRVRLVDSWLPF
jgi:hypothetical protein